MAYVKQPPAAWKDPRSPGQGSFERPGTCPLSSVYVCFGGGGGMCSIETRTLTGHVCARLWALEQLTTVGGAPPPPTLLDPDFVVGRNEFPKGKMDLGRCWSTNFLGLGSGPPSPPPLF